MGKELSKNHIVPKRYLDRFAEKSRNQYVIGTRIKKNDQVIIFPQSTENVGYLKDYYDVDDKPDKKYWEKFFAETQDSLCGSELSRIIAAATLSKPGTRILGEHEKDVLARIIMSQMIRVPSSFEHTKAMYPSIAKEVKALAREIIPRKDRKRYEQVIEWTNLTEKQLKQIHLNVALNPENFEKYCDILKKRLWIVAYNSQRDNMPFITSDNPVLFERFFSDKKGLFVNGISDPFSCIFFPLSPSIAIINYSCAGLMFLADPQFDFNDPECGKTVSNIYDLMDGKTQMLNDEKFIGNKNIAIMDQAFRFSFIPQPLYSIVESPNVV